MVSLAEPKLSDKDLAASYGWALAVLNSDKELKKLFKKAVKEQYTAQRFTAEVMNTGWFKRQSESQRKYVIGRNSDPAQWASEIKRTMASLADQYSSLTGIVLSGKPPVVKNGVAQNGSGSLFWMADAALKMGWNEAQFKDAIASGVNWRKAVAQNSLRGTASGQLQNWRTVAAAYGVKPTDDWFAYRLKDVASGNDSEEGVLGLIKKLSAQRYGAFADDIEAGHTIADLSENYRQSMGNVLEISPNQVDVFDPHIQAALTARDADGKPTPMNITDFEKRLRQDDRWQYTQNAKESVVGKTMDLVKSFGLSA